MGSVGVKLAGRLLLGLLLSATAWVAATAAPTRLPAPGVETTHWIAAHSLAEDGDELFVDADAARFRAAFGEGPREVRTDPHSGRLEAPYLATRVWSWGLHLAGESGPFLMNASALALAAFAASYGLRAALGAAAPVWVALFLYASVAFTSVFRWQSEILVFAAVVLAGALVWGREASTVALRGAEQIYGGDVERPPALWPWPLAGLLIGAAAVRHPAYALLALPMLLDLPRRPRRGARGWAIVLTCLALVLPLGYVTAARGAPWVAPTGIFHPSLIGWNSLYFMLGRNAGLLVGFLPVVALLLSPLRVGGRRYMPIVVLAAVVVELVMAPFDWAGEIPVLGNGWFLPIYGALFFCTGPTLRLRSALFLALAASPFLVPYWIAPLSDGVRPPAAVAPFTTGVREWLPFETSLRELPASAEIVRGGVRLRATGPALRPAAGKLVVAAPRSVVLVESASPLASVRLDFSPSAPATLAVEGGRSGNTTFRPNGEVAFEVALGRPWRRHPLWWSRAPVSIYSLQLAMPGPGKMGLHDPAVGDAAVSFDLGLARVATDESPRP